MAPRPLQLTMAQECVVIDHLEIFRKNGFEFEIDQVRIASQGTSLTNNRRRRSTSASAWPRCHTAKMSPLVVLMW